MSAAQAASMMPKLRTKVFDIPKINMQFIKCDTLECVDKVYKKWFSCPGTSNKDKRLIMDLNLKNRLRIQAAALGMPSRGGTRKKRRTRRRRRTLKHKRRRRRQTRKHKRRRRRHRKTTK